MTRVSTYLAMAVLGVAAAAAHPADAAMCRAGKLSCATSMPVGGYCECTARGVTEDGTVVEAARSKRPVNSTAAGCGARPNAPGCR